MPKPKKDRFIVEVPLELSSGERRVLESRFEVGKRIYNAVLTDALKALEKMRRDPQWGKAREFPRGTKERASAFKAVIEKHDFKKSRFDREAIRHKNNGNFSNRISANEAQKIGQRAFCAVQEYSFGKRGRPRFKGRKRPLHSIEGKTNATGIRWDAGTRSIIWGKLRLMAMMPSEKRDPWLHEALKNETCYVRFLWRMIGGKRRFFVQLIQKGRPPEKHLTQEGDVGADLGPSKIAIVSEEACSLETLNHCKIGLNFYGCRSLILKLSGV